MLKDFWCWEFLCVTKCWIRGFNLYVLHISSNWILSIGRRVQWWGPWPFWLQRVGGSNGGELLVIADGCLFIMMFAFMTDMFLSWHHVFMLCCQVSCLFIPCVTSFQTVLACGNWLFSSQFMLPSWWAPCLHPRSRHPRSHQKNRRRRSRRQTPLVLERCAPAK